MKPAAFDYYRPSTIDEALQLLAEYGDEGKLLAGGQSFIPIMNMRLSTPACIIDINHLNELDYINVEDDRLKIGALTRQSKLETSQHIRDYAPLLAEAASFIGYAQTRNRGTVGGSLVHADPSAEIPLTLLVLNAKAVIRSLEEERLVDLSDFFLTYLTTDIMPDELLTEIQIPLGAMKKGYSFVEFSRKHGDFALVSVACLLDTDAEGKITSGRLTIGGIDAVPLLVEDALEGLIGKPISNDLLDEVAKLAIADAEPDEDLHASKEYRKNLAEVMIKRAINQAYQKAVQRGETE